MLSNNIFNSIITKYLPKLERYITTDEFLADISVLFNVDIKNAKIVIIQ